MSWAQPFESSPCAGVHCSKLNVDMDRGLDGNRALALGAAARLDVVDEVLDDVEVAEANRCVQRSLPIVVAYGVVSTMVDQPLDDLVVAV